MITTTARSESCDTNGRACPVTTGGFLCRFSVVRSPASSRRAPVAAQSPSIHRRFLHRTQRNKTPARPHCTGTAWYAGRRQHNWDASFSWCPVAATPGLFCASQSASVCLRSQLAAMPMPRATPLGVVYAPLLHPIRRSIGDSLQNIPGQAACLAYVLHWPTSLCMYACS